MAAAWYALLSVMLAVYVALDGFDFGVGIVHRLVGRTEDERATLIAAIGPVWDGNEVWLLASGGVLVFAFPRVYATAFSGFYLPLMLVLWLLVGRGLSIELRGQAADPLWRSFWDTGLLVSSTLLALVLGVALGNVVRGVPIDGTGDFHAPLFASFSPSGEIGALDWYTVLVGLFAVAALATHGALYLAWKTDEPLHARARLYARRFLIATALLLVPTTVATAHVAPDLFRSLGHRPVAWVLPLVALAGLVGAFVARARGRDRLAFLCSGAFLVGLLAATAAALYPVMLPSTVSARFTLTATGAANDPHSLAIGFAWWTPAILIAVGYVAYLFRSFAGKVRGGEYH